jgi:hypothetical protein
MTPFASVAILEKLALLKIAFCKALVLKRASLRCVSMQAASVPAALSREAELSFVSFPAIHTLHFSTSALS